MSLKQGKEGIWKGWEVGRVTGRDSYSTWSRQGPKGGGEEEAAQGTGVRTVLNKERVPGKLEAPGQVSVTTQPGILALRQQGQTGHKFKVITNDTG